MSKPQGSKYWLCGKCSLRGSKGMTGVCRGNSRLPGCNTKTHYAIYQWCRVCAKKYNICSSCGILKTFKK